MKKSLALVVILVAFMLGTNQNLFAQNEPVMYFCEKYGNNCEEGVSDRFTTGNLTIMVKCDYSLNLENVSIQFDKYNSRSKLFEFHSRFDYVIEATLNKVSFAKNERGDLKIDNAGIYRVSLLDDRDKTVTSALIEIID